MKDQKWSIKTLSYDPQLPSLKGMFAQEERKEIDSWLEDANSILMAHKLF